MCHLNIYIDLNFGKIFYQKKWLSLDEIPFATRLKVRKNPCLCFENIQPHAYRQKTGTTKNVNNNHEKAQTTRISNFFYAIKKILFTVQLLREMQLYLLYTFENTVYSVRV